MNEKDEQSLSARVAALETAIATLRNELLQLTSKVDRSTPGLSGDRQRTEPPEPMFVERKPVPQPAAPAPSPPVPAVTRAPSKPARKAFVLPDNMRKSEYWLNKLGIGLILFAVVFLFKYSIDKGWLTPPIRIVFGLVLGTALLVIGFRIYGRKKHFSQVLTGGAIATYYITGFAAFQLFALVSYPVALGFMIAVTILSFFVSLRQDEAVFSLIGAMGGLGTPFLLYFEGGTASGLMLYTCLILAGTGAIYFFQGWRSLLWLSIVGGWFVIMLGLIEASIPLPVGSGDAWAFQIGILVCWLLFWMVPVLRQVVRIANPDRWRPGLIGVGDGAISENTGRLLDNHVILITVVVPFVAFMLSTMVWPDLSKEAWGRICLAGSAIYMVVNLFLRRLSTLKNLAYTHAIMFLVFFTLAISLLLEGDTLFVALVTEAAALQLVALRIASRGVSIFARVLFCICGLWMFDRLYLTEIFRLWETHEGTAIFNVLALSDLWALVLGVLMSIRLKSIAEKRLFLIVVFVFGGAWLCRELTGNIEFVAIVAEATLIHFIAFKTKERSYSVVGHLFFALVAIWLVIRMATPDTAAIAILNSHALINLLPIVISLGLFKLLKTNGEILIYRLVAHIAFMGWFISEFVSRENGQGYITIAWGIYAALLLIAGLRFNYQRLRTVSMTTIFIVVAKLFLIDLAELEVLWRILLFMGFGGLFLFLSYYFQDLWKAKPKPTGDPEQ